MNIDLELEVFYAASLWISFNLKDHSKNAKYLLLKNRD